MRTLPNDYDSDPGRFAANQLATRRWVRRQDVHVDAAQRLADDGCRIVADIGGGNGTLARLLADRGVRAVVIDPAGYAADAPRPVVRADACMLPFADDVFDGAAALYMLYHLAEPLVALREARRVLRRGGLLAVAAPSRRNDPELASVLPAWGRPLGFDAENGPDQLRKVFDVVEVQRWDTPVLHIPDHDALAVYLRGRGVPAERAAHLNTPMTITKRGMIAWARKSWSTTVAR